MRIPVPLAVTWSLMPGFLTAQTSSADYTEPYQQKALQIFRAAIGYRTAATHGQVPQLANHLAGEFRAGGFPDDVVHVLPHTLPSGEETAVLVVRYRGDGSSGNEPVLLLAHAEELQAKYGANPAVVGQLDRAMLERKFRQIVEVGDDFSSPNRACADAGSLRYTAFAYNESTRRYRPLRLREEGDSPAQNRGGSAPSLSAWLRTVIIDYPVDGLQPFQEGFCTP